MCNGIPAFAIVDPAEHGYSESIQALQTSLKIQHPGTILSIANAISRHAVLLKLILDARKVKIDWLLRVVMKILLHVISGMTVSITE